MQNSGSRVPLGDKTNTTKEGYRMQHAIEYSIVFPMYMLYRFFLKLSPVDAKDQEQRARWHAMSQEQRDEKNKRRRESYHNKKISIKLPKLPIKK